MTKSEVAQQIINTLAAKAAESGATAGQLDHDQITDVIDAFANVVENEVASGGMVTLRNFGSFQSKHKGEKVARNLSTGTPIIIPAHQVPVFMPSKDFKAKVRTAAMIRDMPTGDAV